MTKPPGIIQNSRDPAPRRGFLRGSGVRHARYLDPRLCRAEKVIVLLPVRREVRRGGCGDRHDRFRRSRRPRRPPRFGHVLDVNLVLHRRSRTRGEERVEFPFGRRWSGRRKVAFYKMINDLVRLFGLIGVPLFLVNKVNQGNSQSVKLKVQETHNPGNSKSENLKIWEESQGLSPC